MTSDKWEFVQTPGLYYSYAEKQDSWLYYTLWNQAAWVHILAPSLNSVVTLANFPMVFCIGFLNCKTEIIPKIGKRLEQFNKL